MNEFDTQIQVEELPEYSEYFINGETTMADEMEDIGELADWF